MQLAEQGKLRLFDPVETYVPTFPRVFGESAKIHHLLSHSSGLPNLGSSDAFIFGSLGFDENWLPIAKLEDIANFVKDAGEWAVAKPGSQFLYSNEGYQLLGYIISKLSGIPYDEYVRKNILAPLNMTRSFYSKADVDMNFVMTGRGRLGEVRGPAERIPFAEDDLLRMMAVAKKAIAHLTQMQKKSLGSLKGLWAT